jgi:aminopeptidase N
MQVAEITRDETAERARLLRVRSYDIELDLTGGAETFRSTSVMSFDCAEPGAATFADLIADTVHEITLNSAAVDPATAWQDGRIALAGLAARNELRVVADCAYGTGGVGLQRSVDSADGRIYTFTQFAAAHARQVFANFEQPDLKASFAFHVTAPRHWIVVSNQAARETEPAEDEAAVWHFEPTPPISTYLAAIAAGEYYLVRQSHTTPDGQVIPLALACRQSMLPYLEAKELFAITTQGLDYFTRLFGTAYPFAKFDQVFVPDNAGAMENAGCVIITESLLFRSRVTGTIRENRAYVILHEMAHQWFGDLVTMRWWDDLWLNESFATLLAFQAAAEATRFTSSWTTFCGRKAAAYLQDQQPPAHPVAADVTTLSAAEANFDAISYDKGAAVLKQLVAYAGRDRFFTGIRAYFAEHGWQNATLADLLAALAASSGRNLTDWSKAWLQTAGPNTLRPELAVGPDATFTSFAVLQQAPAAHPTLRPHHIAIGLYNRNAGGSLVRTYRVETGLSGPRTQVPGLVGRPQPDLVLLNDDDLDYAIVRFDARSMATLTESIGRFDDDLARAICWSAVTDMASQAELPVPAFIRMVAAGMGHERSVSVLENVLKTTSRLLQRTADPAYVPEGTALLAAEATALLRAAEPGSDFQLAWARLLGWTATAPGQLDLLAAVIDGSTKVPGLAVDTELRWQLLRRLAATGRAGDAEIDAELARDATDAGRRNALGCRARIPDAQHKAAAWRLVAESADFGLQDSLEVAKSFNMAEHARLLAPYAEKYLAQLPAIWAARTGFSRVLLCSELFPYPAASPELLHRIAEFLAGPDISPALARVVIEGRDVAEKALQSRALPPLQQPLLTDASS